MTSAYVKDFGETRWRDKQGARRRAQGDLGHMPSASLGQDATLSLIVRGRGQERFIRELGNSLIRELGNSLIRKLEN